MIKSTASAGPVESAVNSPTQYYLWEFPQKPVCVRLSLDVVESIERDVLESFRAITARGSEVGGLLLGRSETGSTLRTVVDGYELFACDYTRGPLYLLSDEEKARLEESIERKTAGLAGQVVGFFRSNTRKDLTLDDEDLELFQKYFARPEQVFLLVKPYAAKASAAGIFIWEGAKVRAEGSYIEFPFRRADLGKGEFAKSIVTDKPKAKETPIDPPVALPNAPKPGSRAQVLPFSLKRDEEPPVAAPPLRREDRAAVVTLSPKPEEEPEPAPAARKTPEPPLERKPVEEPAVRKTAEKPVVPVGAPIRQRQEEKKEEKKEDKKEEAKAAAAAPPAEPASKTVKKEAAAPAAPAPATAAPAVPKADPLPARSPFGGKKLWALFGGITMLGLAGGTMFYLRTHSNPPGAVVSNVSGSLDLKAELSNGQLLVTWNREAPSIKSAQHAVLSIVDGAQKEDVPLDLTQIRGGSIVYSPDPKGTGDVSFRLEVTDANSGRTRSESVHATAPSAQPQPGSDNNLAKPSALVAQKSPAEEAARMAPETQSSSADSQPASAQQAPPQAPAPAPKPFSLAARVRTPEPTDLPDAPSVIGGAASGSRPLVPAPATQLAPPPPPKAAPTPAQPGAGASTQPPPKVGGRVQEPRLLRKIDPVYPPMARQARVGGVVRMQASIGKDGKIRRVEVLSGPPLLRQAAVDAVQKWVYSPSLLNGSPIESTTDVELNFNLTSR
jgi:protein TonB